MKTIKIHIKGMHCKSCEALLSGEFEDIGVTSSTIDHTKGIAKVTFDEKTITIEQLKKVILDEGYTVEKVVN